MKTISLSAPVRAAEVAALIPAYLEHRHIAQVVERTRPHVAEVLVVDDGSADDTTRLAEAAGARVIRHSQNRGKGAALKTGLRDLLEKDFLYFAMLDADGQHLPEELPIFIEDASDSKAALVMGSRMQDAAAMPVVRRMTNRFMSRVISHICRQSIPDSQCGFRLIHREIAPLLFCRSDAYDYETEMLFIVSRAGYAISSVPVSTVYADETSKIRPLRDTLRFAKLVTRYL